MEIGKKKQCHISSREFGRTNIARELMFGQLSIAVTNFLLPLFLLRFVFIPSIVVGKKFRGEKKFMGKNLFGKKMS